MKILITGVYSTGKTTLAETVADRYTRLGVRTSVRPDPARECPLPLNTTQTLDASHWMIGSVLMREAALAQEGSALVICDRGLPDILSHTYDVEVESRERNLAFGVQAITQICAEWLRTYDFVFRTSIDYERPIADDGLRVTDRSYQAHMDSMLTRALTSTGAAFSWLPHSLPDRVEAILASASDLPES